MKTYSWLLLGTAMLLSNFLHAQAACPPGTVAYGGGNAPNVCGPDNSQQQQEAPQQRNVPPPPQWATRWGAIATDEPHGILGAVTGLTSESEAKHAALADCQAKGGSPCKFEIAYDNECASLVVGTKDYSINTGTTTDAANQLAMKTCSADGDPKCHVYYSACSLPARIQ